MQTTLTQVKARIGVRPTMLMVACGMLLLPVVVSLLSGCGGEDQLVAVSGRATSPTGNRTQSVGLFLWPSESLVASANVQQDGTFVVRMERTDEMEQEQAAKGGVGFLLRGWFYAGGICTNLTRFYLRFENGRWVDAVSREPAFVVFRGVGSCRKVSLPFGLPTD